MKTGYLLKSILPMHWILLVVVLVTTSRLACAYTTPSVNTPIPVTNLQHALHKLEAASRNHQPVEGLLLNVRTQFHALDQYVDTLVYLPAARAKTPSYWSLLLDGRLQHPLPILDETVIQNLVAYRHAVARIAYGNLTAANHEELQDQARISIRIGESLTSYR